MSAARRNVEIKAVDPDPARTLERAPALGASDQGVLVRHDTYFAVPGGRLKLREQEPGGAEMIAREFMPADAPIHLADLWRVRHTTTLGALLPLSFGPESLA